MMNNRKKKGPSGIPSKEERKPGPSWTDLIHQKNNTDQLLTLTYDSTSYKPPSDDYLNQEIKVAKDLLEMWQGSLDVTNRKVIKVIYLLYS
jgi:hypothetical protein